MGQTNRCRDDTLTWLADRKICLLSHTVPFLPAAIAKSNSYLPVVAFATEPGDLTVHLSCTLHESTPPKVSERRVMYIEVPLALRGDDVRGPTAEAALREQVSDI